jgi:hypothetical protein
MVEGGEIAGQRIDLVASEREDLELDQTARLFRKCRDAVLRKVEDFKSG